MKKNKSFFTNYWYIVLIVLLGGFLRFYKLDWGGGFFFHPDEYHIVGAVDRLHFPDQMNPHFFSYGSFIVYFIYFTKLIFSIFNPQVLSFNSFLIGRFYSALFSTLTILIIFAISKKIFKEPKYSYISAFLISINPGLIQQAHFTTPESILLFWVLLTLYLILSFIQKQKNIIIYLASIALGIAIGTKVLALIFVPILLYVSLFNHKINIPRTFVSLVLIIVSFFVIFPYSILNWNSFRSTTLYETGLAQGKQAVFYTTQFSNTTPFIFQITKIFPFALGPSVLILGLGGSCIFIISLLKMLINKRKLNKNYLILIITFLVFFVFNATLFAKWTRFISPTFPFFAIFTSYFLLKITNKYVYITLLRALILTSIIWSIMFFSIYLKPDVRLTASNWINKNIPVSAHILTESRNTLEVPLWGNYQKLPFEFYEIDNNPRLAQTLPNELVQAGYFIIQSRRLFANYLPLENQYPLISNFYKMLFTGKLGFVEIKEFNSYPSINLFGNNFQIPDENAEETWSVFDHPVIRIYQKQTYLSQKDYAKLLGI